VGAQDVPRHAQHARDEGAESDDESGTADGRTSGHGFPLPIQYSTDRGGIKNQECGISNLESPIANHQ
jgi:hypothetical protein